ncbi:NAD(P)/FAD-dependent oxidoreductase [Luteimonas sp. XNQY3]|nr:FAD/NAD(P)-binding oxidoreductase [Luteimonas sp. XNQY3]MCD9005896.1 NAD(P)/FAD-dependent oxidoreductase [Luteimonas sp. XNQY3]
MSERRLRCDVVVVGAGPAGMSAAQAAASHGASVIVVDAQPQPGGQIWRHDVRDGAPPPSSTLQAALAAAGVTLLPQSEVVGSAGRRLFVRIGNDGATIDHEALVLATGARELLLPFPGWTLPGVTGAGGAQALAKQGWPVRGQRVVLAGSGPLLLAAAATLRRHGADVLGIHEQAALPAVAGFAAGLWRWPGKLAQALQLRASLAAVPYRTGSHVLRAIGDDRLRAVELRVGGRSIELECDMLGCGFGLVPNVELALSLGCALDDGTPHPRVIVDDVQRSSIAHVYAAGEACGIGGVDCARIEGGIAGHAAVGQARAARALLSRRARARRFAAALRKTFALHDDIRALADGSTLICRCEDVRLDALAGCDGARETKLMTRFGMGPCQGRICGTALAEIRGVARTGFRVPIFPVSLDVLSCFDDAPRIHPQES